MRFLLGLLLGAIIGIGVTVSFVSRGGGDYIFATSPRVLRLEDDLHRATQEREHVVQKLEESTLRIEKMTERFTDLEHRLQELQKTIHSTFEPAETQENTPGEVVERTRHIPELKTSPASEQAGVSEETAPEAAAEAGPESPQGEAGDSADQESAPPRRNEEEHDEPGGSSS